MAELFRTFRGARGADQLAWVVARHVDVDAALAEHAYYRAGIAMGVVASHKKTGDTKIEVTKADVDYHVKLTDDSAKPNPISIEFGGAHGRGGIHALGTAFPEINALRGD